MERGGVPGNHRRGKHWKTQKREKIGDRVCSPGVRVLAVFVHEIGDLGSEYKKKRAGRQASRARGTVAGDEQVGLVVLETAVAAMVFHTRPTEKQLAAAVRNHGMESQVEGGGVTTSVAVSRHRAGGHRGEGRRGKGGRQ